ncbi:MAG TPA: ABC transporter permease [Vicinamibacterales bacterium]|nr:ABC transporter permease [Vicinamibacterales bacterium]
MRIARWRFTVPLRLKSILRGAQVERELDEELRFHLDHKIEEGLAAGLTPAAARDRALRAMGGLDQRREEIRDARRIHWLTDFVADVRYAVRGLRRTSGLAAFVAVTLAVGIGTTAATLSMVDALIFRPYPVPQPGRVVSLVGTSRDNAFDGFSYREYLDIRDHTTSYDGVLAYTAPQGVGFSIRPGETPRVRPGTLVSANYFRVLGVEPQPGRAFRDDEDAAPGRDRVVVLGRDFWKHELGSDRSAVGRTIRLNGADFTVIGVAPDSFPGLQIFTNPDFYVPLATASLFSIAPGKNFFEDRDGRELFVKARLKAGTTLADARAELALLARGFERDHPAASRDRGAAVRTSFEMRTRDDDNLWKFMVVFAVLGLAVLLVACTNVAGLLLSRARGRTREIAVRLAMGAGRFRLIRLLLTETLLLAGLGGLGGVAVGYAGIRFFHTLSIPSELPVTIPFRLDARVLVASLVLSLLSALVCGLAPALQSTRTNLVDGLKSADADEPRPRHLSGRNALVVAQVAMSLMLLTASFLMVRGFHQGAVAPIGFAKDGLLMARFDPRLVQYDAAQIQQFYRLLAERVRAVPGVIDAGLTGNPPLGLDDFGRLAFVPDGFEMPPGRESFSSAMDTVDPGFFATLGVAIVRGRGFRASDTAEAPRVAIVNEQLARHYWPGADAVGQHLRVGSRTGFSVEIVGVARTVKYRQPSERPTDFVYVPLAQHPTTRMVLLMRTAGDPRLLVDPMKAVVRALDANLPISEARTFDDLYRYNVVDGPQVAIDLVGTMGAVGLLLAIAGLYGLVAYNVSRRTREIGIRMAVGAGPADVLRLVMAKGVALSGVGTAIGLALGFGVERLMNAMLFNAGGVDLLVYLVVVPSMFLVTLLAAYLPARRASRIAPTEALRYE